MEEKIVLVLEPEPCCYWNFEDQTCTHTCGGCYGLSEGNSMDTIRCGVMINGNRYCMLNCDIYGEVLKTLKKEERFKEYREHHSGDGKRK